MDNISDRVVRTRGARIVENGAGTYTFDVFLPAYSILVDAGMNAEAVWDAATSAAGEVGLYASTTDDYGQPSISTEIDADALFTAVDMKATDLTVGQSINFDKTGGVEGAYASGTATHWDLRSATVDRWLRFSIVSVGAGTAGRTVVWAIVARPELVEVTQ